MIAFKTPDRLANYINEIKLLSESLILKRREEEKKLDLLQKVYPFKKLDIRGISVYTRNGNFRRPLAIDLDCIEGITKIEKKDSFIIGYREHNNILIPVYKLLLNETPNENLYLDIKEAKNISSANTIIQQSSYEILRQEALEKIGERNEM